jgi:hypothetical protein
MTKEYLHVEVKHLTRKPGIDGNPGPDSLEKRAEANVRRYLGEKANRYMVERARANVDIVFRLNSRSEKDGLAAAPQSLVPSPRPHAEWLLAWFLRKAQRDGVLGDIEEEFVTDKLPTLCRRSAVLWYWGMVIKSLWPCIWAFLRRALGIALLVKKLGP